MLLLLTLLLRLMSLGPAPAGLLSEGQCGPVPLTNVMMGKQDVVEGSGSESLPPPPQTAAPDWNDGEPSSGSSRGNGSATMRIVYSLASGLSSLPRTLSSRAHSPAPLSEPLLSSDAVSVACETVAMTPHTPRSSPDDESKQGSKQDLGSTNPKVRVSRAYFCGFMILVDLSVLIYSIYLNGWSFENFNRNPMLGPSASVLTHLGAKDTPLIREGQWYRLLSAMFLHAGIAHFCFNSFSLWRVGKPLEELYGPWRMAILFLVSGLSGNMLSECDPAGAVLGCTLVALNRGDHAPPRPACFLRTVWSVRQET